MAMVVPHADSALQRRFFAPCRACVMQITLCELTVNAKSESPPPHLFQLDIPLAKVQPRDSHAAARIRFRMIQLR